MDITNNCNIIGIQVPNKLIRTFLKKSCDVLIRSKNTPSIILILFKHFSKSSFDILSKGIKKEDIFVLYIKEWIDLINFYYYFSQNLEVFSNTDYKIIIYGVERLELIIKNFDEPKGRTLILSLLSKTRNFFKTTNIACYVIYTLYNDPFSDNSKVSLGPLYKTNRAYYFLLDKLIVFSSEKKT